MMPEGPWLLSGGPDLGRADCACSPPRSPREKIYERLHRGIASTRATSRPRAGRSARRLGARLRADDLRRPREPAQRSCWARAGAPSRPSASSPARTSRKPPSTPIHLFLFVKVRERWADDPEPLPREWGSRVPQVLRAGTAPWSGTDEGIVLGARSHGESGAILGAAHEGARPPSRLPPRRARQAPRAGDPAGQHGGRFLARPARRADGQLHARAAGRARGCADGLAGGALRARDDERAPAPSPRAATRIRRSTPPRRRWSRISTTPELAPRLFVAFELALLAELGFGLDLGACAVTGTTEGLVWVSPKTGRAVSREAGAPYADKLLPLPAFLGARGGGRGSEVPRRSPRASR